MLNELLQEDIPRILLEEIRAKNLDIELGEVPRHFVRISHYGIVSFVEISDNSPVITLWRSPSGVISQNEDGIINYANCSAAKMLGYQKLVDIPYVYIVPERYSSQRAQQYDTILKTGIPYKFNTKRIHKRGHQINIVTQIFRYGLSIGKYGIAEIIKPNIYI